MLCCRLANCSNSAARSCELYRFLPIAFLPVRSLIALGLAIWGWSGAYIEHNKDSGNETWNQLSQTQSAKVWSGYAYENTCLKHLPNIKKALGISGVYTQASTFLFKGNEEEKGAQIDLVLDRNDRIINLFEIKFYNTEFTLSEADAKALRNQMWTFKEKTKTKKHLMIVLVSTFGMEPNKHSLGLVEKILTLDDLF